MASSAQFGCKKLPFQVGDMVRTPQGSKGITAIGKQNLTNAIVYRVGRNQYWHEWQITKIRRKSRTTK